MFRPRRSKTYRIFCVLFGILLALLALELLLRLAGFGYNLRHHRKKESKADFKIFCIGESTTWGDGTKDPQKQSYPAQLELMLAKAYPEKEIRCFYDDTIGQNTSEILLKFAFYLKKYEPDLVIFMTGINNWWNMDKSNILVFNNNRGISSFALNTDIFLDRFRVWKLFKWLMLSLGAFDQRWNYFMPSAYQNDKERYLLCKRLQKKYGQRFWILCDSMAKSDISQMIEICKDVGVKMIICSYPREALGRLSAIHEWLSLRYGLPFVDNQKFFNDLPDSDAYFSKDRWHPNEEGYRLVAQNIYNCIIENRFVEEDR